MSVEVKALLCHTGDDLSSVNLSAHCMHRDAGDSLSDDRSMLTVVWAVVSPPLRQYDLLVRDLLDLAKGPADNDFVVAEYVVQEMHYDDSSEGLDWDIHAPIIPRGMVAVKG